MNAEDLAVLACAAVVPLSFVGLFVYFFATGPSKESKMLAREEHERKKLKDKNERESRIRESKERQKREKSKRNFPTPKIDLEGFPYTKDENGLWACGWQEDEITGHQSLIAYGMGFDAEEEVFGLKVWFEPTATGGLWQLGVVYEGSSLLNEATTLYLLIDGVRYQGIIKGSGRRKMKTASFFLMDAELLRALTQSTEVKYSFIDERGELLPGATDGFKRLGWVLYEND